MNIKQIEGATRTLGEGQGYGALPIRDETVNCTVNGEDMSCMTTAWEPTAEEVERLMTGAPVYLKILGSAHPPVMLEVGEPPDRSVARTRDREIRNAFTAGKNSRDVRSPPPAESIKNDPVLRGAWLAGRDSTS